MFCNSPLLRINTSFFTAFRTHCLQLCEPQKFCLSVLGCAQFHGCLSCKQLILRLSHFFLWPHTQCLARAGTSECWMHCIKHIITPRYFQKSYIFISLICDFLSKLWLFKSYIFSFTSFSKLWWFGEKIISKSKCVFCA
jgi:hypothetical protein